jgi:hypothetical protein
MDFGLVFGFNAHLLIGATSNLGAIHNLLCCLLQHVLSPQPAVSTPISYASLLTFLPTGDCPKTNCCPHCFADRTHNIVSLLFVAAVEWPISRSSPNKESTFHSINGRKDAKFQLLPEGLNRPTENGLYLYRTRRLPETSHKHYRFGRLGGFHKRKHVNNFIVDL